MWIDNFRGCSRELFYLESVEYHNIEDLTTAEYTVYTLIFGLQQILKSLQRGMQSITKMGGLLFSVINIYLNMLILYL